MAPQVGLEPTTLRLTAGCSAIELLRSVDGAEQLQLFYIMTLSQGAQDSSLALPIFCH
jgi:hypothetical protein